MGTVMVVVSFTALVGIVLGALVTAAATWLLLTRIGRAIERNPGGELVAELGGFLLLHVLRWPVAAALGGWAGYALAVIA